MELHGARAICAVRVVGTLMSNLGLGIALQELRYRKFVRAGRDTAM